MKVKNYLLRVANLISDLEALGLTEGNCSFSQINDDSCIFVIYNLTEESCAKVFKIIAKEFVSERKLIDIGKGTVSCYIYG